MAERLIYADLLRKDLDKTIEHIAKKQGGTEEGSFAVGMCLAFKTMINEQPTIEAKPIVYCKDCKYNVANSERDPLDITDYTDITCEYFMTDGMSPNDYCSQGRRADNG